MSYKDKFTNDEWLTLEYSPLWVFTAVAGIDGQADQKEVEAFTKELMDAPIYKDELIREVFMACITDFAALMNSYKADSRQVDVGLGQVADILDAKYAGHANDFKKVLLSIGAKVANASGPMFGEKVSDEEKLAFAYVMKALRAKV